MMKEYTFDRIEGEVAVCHDRENGQQTELPVDKLMDAGVPEGGIFAAHIDENEILNIEYLADQTDAVEIKAKRRLAALFGRRKEDKT